MLSTFTASVRDGLSNLAASLGADKDKAASDAFVFRELDRAQIEAMYRGDWLARKVVDIVPADMCREWRQWSGERADVARIEAAERRLGLRRAVQRAMVLGRLYGGSAIVIGTGESDPAALARPLDPADVRYGGLRFLHVVSRWQLGTPGLDRDPLSPWYGEAEVYEVVAPGRGALVLHPSRVVRFLGNPWPDPSVAPTPWSDSVLQSLYDAVHAVALTMAGATSLMHEAKVDVVTVPNLSEHLSSAETTAQLSARFGYAAAMKSINNLLLLGDGETWNRQKVDFAGLPEMVRTFLQAAAGAADIPVTRLLGQSPAGFSATGESDTRNYYDMIAARQELELRPALERLDRIIAASEGIDPSALTFDFRPLWQLDAATTATIALQKAQATQVYAGLNLWPTAVTVRLVQAQLAEDGTYPNASAVFGEDGAADPTGAAPTLDFDPDQPRDPQGRWTVTGGGGSAPPASSRTTPTTFGSVTVPMGSSSAGPSSRTSKTGERSSSIAQLIPPDIFFEDPPVVPDPGIPYLSDPTLPPSPDYVWKGPPGSQPGDPKGSWYKEKTGDAVHAVALTMAGATSLMHEAKVDIVTVPNLSEHLSSAETTNQLSARSGTAIAMTSLDILLLLGDEETWNRQKVDFAGLPEMVKTFLQVAAGAVDIGFPSEPVPMGARPGDAAHGEVAGGSAGDGRSAPGAEFSRDHGLQSRSGC